MNKTELRKHYKALRREIGNKSEKSLRIWHKIKNTPEYRTARTIALYCSLPDEVDTAVMIADALSEGKTVCLPKVQSEDMEFFAIDTHTAFQTGAFGIREPLSGKRMDAASIDLMIVPLLAADNQNHRIGYGGGYYDRYLRRYSGNCIGVCFRQQRSQDTFPMQAHDIALQQIISDE